MPVTQSASAPYAPTAAILSLIERHRQRGLPVPVNLDVLSRAGISASLVDRTLYALKVLDLIDDQGKPTPVFEGLRVATDSEYKSKKADWLHSTYADALKFVDPAVADSAQIRDAFRSYNPPGQRERMVTLFTGLFQDAGLMPERKRQRSKSTGSKNGEPVRRQKLTTDKEVTADRNLPQSPLEEQDHAKHTASVMSQLLDKFPKFDPNWAPEIQAKWFEGYERLLGMGSK